MIKFLTLSFFIISFSHAMENNNLKPDSINEEPLLNSNKVIQPSKSAEDEKIPHNYKGINKKKNDQQGADLEKLALMLLSELPTFNTNPPNNNVKNDNPFYSLKTDYKVSRVTPKKN